MKKIKKEIKKVTLVPKAVKLPKTTIKTILSYLPKLKDYFLLKEEEDYLILGTILEILEHKTFLGNIFQPRTANEERTMSVFFIVTLTDTPLTKIKITDLTNLMHNRIPIVRFNKVIKHSIEDIKYLCDKTLKIE